MTVTDSIILTQPPNLTGEVSIEDRIPRFTGNYSSVYRGTYNGNPVAIKVIKATGHDEAVRRKLRRETLVWYSAKHPNIYPFYGDASDDEFGTFGALISPWCHNGDANQYLETYGESMTFTPRVNLWAGVINGVSYLHGREPPIVHGDLKPGNILIDEDETPKICDFGLARVFSDLRDTGMTTTSEYAGTARYLAPEIVASEINSPPTLASDVYALGSLGLEFVYLQKPYSNHANNGRGQIFRDLGKGVLPATSMPQVERTEKYKWERIWRVIQSCWAADPQSRPTASEIGHKLRSARTSLDESIIRMIISIIQSEHEALGHPEGPNRARLYSSPLYQLCLVSKTWRKLTIPLLYGRIRLYLSQSLDRLFELVYALDVSKERVKPLLHESGCHGLHTKSLLLVIVPHLTNFESLSVVQKMIQMMPNLRRVHVSTRIPHNNEVPALSTFRLTCDNSSPFLQSLWVFLSITCVKQLDVTLWDTTSEESFDDEPTSAHGHQILLPNLQEIDFNGMEAHLLSEFVDRISDWELPRLARLQRICFPSDEEDKMPVYRFLEERGHLLSSLSASYASTEEFAYILSHCPNLQHARTALPHLGPLRHFPPHNNLNLLSVAQKERFGPKAAENLLESKQASQTVFPGLIEATVHEFSDGETEEVAEFRPGDNFITVRQCRLYDDGHWSPLSLGGKGEGFGEDSLNR
ncbi:hypothetical protein M408DRAFT_24081 [Serendipita vermifera MAFF 305830]|uniref:Protein kinase domain-containing protein n=1 Tax=Serendipita vermifera MAFF 305830 TaxID=933852 RepID=A0A0C2WPA1_SERVB|nr:hypothetical protein M408DRAFT_24081 [Serendipita vermifera MAFF 305830]